MSDLERFREEQLEQLVDEEGGDGFGLPNFKEHIADTLEPAVLKDWSAADFASIYVRFRPHLERHARKFLQNPSQVEEVVQDAFLYLMTTLPGLDSELGVLKFLKWKVRLLSLDVIRLNSRYNMASLEEQPEIANEAPELSQDLERADDAAIVALALAKLHPRHREVLIASIYEEKSNEVVASQLGLTENATRQLLFRARSSFKKALIGEADTQGMSASQLLSLAARKAARESGKYASAAGAFLLALAVSLGVLPNLNQLAIDWVSQPAPVQSQIVEASVDPEASAPETQAIPAEAETEPQQIDVALEELEGEVGPPTSDSRLGGALAPVPSVPKVPTPTESEAQIGLQDPILNEMSLATILATDVSQAGYYINSYASSDFLSAGFRASSIEIFGGTGISAFLDIEFADPTIHNVVFQMWVEGKRYYAVAMNSSADVRSVVNGFEIVHRSSNFWVVDDSGEVFDQSPLASAFATLTLIVDTTGNPISASMQVAKDS